MRSLVLDIDALIAEAKKEVEQPETVTLETLVAGKVVEFEFTKLPVEQWRDLINVFPARPDVIRDKNVGYNQDRLPSGYPVSHIRIVDGDDSVEVTPDQWQQLFDLLESPDRFHVSITLWGLHEWGPANKLVEAKKALKRKSGRSRKR